MNRILITTISLLLILASQTAFSGDDINGLTKIDRGSCLMFPEMPEFETLKNDFHYEVNRDKYNNCLDNSDGTTNYDTCDDVLKIKYYYQYITFTTVEYYNAQGTLVTSTVKKKKQRLSAWANEDTRGVWVHDGITYHDIPADEEAEAYLKAIITGMRPNIEHDIQKTIYESDHDVCEDSFYK